VSPGTGPNLSRLWFGFQPPSHQPLVDRVNAQVTGYTDPKNSKGDSDDSGVECEPDECNSSDEEGSEQIPLGASLYDA